MTLLALAAAALNPNPAATPELGRTARVFATIHHSEWCPAGSVSVDLRTGRYAFTPRAARRVCNQPGLERPTLSGRLRADVLETLRADYLRVLSEGLRKPDCNGFTEDGAIIISNGGTPVLVVTTGAFSAAAPDNLACWTDAASALEKSLNGAFTPPARP